VKRIALLGRMGLALAVVLAALWPMAVEASVSRDVSFKASPLAAAKVLPQMQTPAEDALAKAALADECEALCELAASVDAAPLGYVSWRRPPIGIVFLYDDTSLLAEYDTNGNEVAKYDYGGDRLIRLTRSDEGTRYFSFDSLGSVTGLTDTTGAVTAAYHLDAWGNYRFTSELAPSKNRFGFTGHYWDNEAGLYYAKARFYDPFTARFTQADSFLGDIDDPPSLHRYFYANANPTMFVDPSGNVAIVDNLIGGAASVAIGWGVSKLTGSDYQWKDAAVDFGLGFATSGLSSLTKLKHAGKVTQWAARAGTEAALDSGAEVARREWKGEEYTAVDIAAGAASNLVIGEAGAAIGRRLGKSWRGVREGRSGAPRVEIAESRVSATASLDGAAIDAAQDAAIAENARRTNPFLIGAGRNSSSAFERGSSKVTPPAPSSVADLVSGRGYSVSDPPVRIAGKWSLNDMKQVLLGHPPRGLGSPDLHHADQMPGSAIHEVLPGQHRTNPALHPNKFNQGVTSEMREADRRLHWWYRAREQGADKLLPNWIYDPD